MAIHWTPEIYNVIAVHNHNNAIIMRRNEYELSDLNGNPIMGAPNIPKRFFGNDLQKVPLNHVPTSVNPPTVGRAERLNFV